MVWFYERLGLSCRFECHAVSGRRQFELIVERSDGLRQVERFADPDALLQRQLELDQELSRDGWSGPFGRRSLLTAPGA
jgi:hypothetical protein